MPKIISVKCPNCGANLELDDNKRKAKCQYCNTNILIEKDINDVITANIYKTSKYFKSFLPIFFIIFTFIFATTFTFIIFTFARSFKTSSSFDKTRFNQDFTFANGTKNGLFVGETLDDVISSNKRNKNHQIYVKYNDYNTNNEDDILDIKDSLDTFNYYEVLINYNNSGYVNLVIIRDKK